MKYLHKRFFNFIIISALLAAYAQVTADELPKITVEGETAGTLLPLSAEDAESRINEITPGGVSVIKANDYKTGTVLGGQDALRLAPGVYAQSRTGYENIKISIRGSGISAPFSSRGVRILRDGLPLSRADGFIDTSYADYENAEYIEIYRGANALQYGSSYLGGAINLVSPTGRSQSGIHLRLNGGSDNLIGGRASFGNVFGNNDEWDIHTVVSGFDTDGFRDNNDQSRIKFSGNLGRHFGANSEGRFYFEIEEQKLDSPGTLTRAQVRDDPSQATAGNIRANAALDMTPRSHIGYKHSFFLDDDRLDVGAYWTNTDFENPSSFADFFYNDTDYGVTLRHEINGELFGHQNQFVWGVIASDGKSENDTFGPVFFGDFVAEPSTGQFEDVRNDRTTIDIFAEEQFYVTPSLSFLVGGQFVYAERKSRTEVPTNPTFFPIFFESDESEIYRGFSPKLGTILNLQPEVQLFANVSRSFEPPNSFEFDNASVGLLDEQTAWTVEVGTRGGNSLLSWDVAFYHAWVDDEILSIETPPNSNNFETNNVDDTTHTGIELGLASQLDSNLFAQGDTLDLKLAYTWSHFKFDDDQTFGNNELPGIPEHVANLEALYRHPSGVFVEANVQIASSWYADLANSLRASSFAIFGMRAGYEGIKWRTFVDVRNLADEKYATSTEYLVDANGMDAAVFNPGIERSIFLGLEFDIGMLH